MSSNMPHLCDNTEIRSSPNVAMFSDAPVFLGHLCVPETVEAMFVDCRIAGISMRALVDSGCTGMVIARHIVQENTKLREKLSAQVRNFSR